MEFSLQYIYGIGHTTAKAILVSTGVENKRTKVGAGPPSRPASVPLTPQLSRTFLRTAFASCWRQYTAGAQIFGSQSCAGRRSYTAGLLPCRQPGLRCIPPVFKTLAASVLPACPACLVALLQDLTEEELTKLREEVDRYTVEGDLRRFNALNIKRLKEIGCYRGRRHYNNLPVRGQRTKNNARTRKGRYAAAWVARVAWVGPGPPGTSQCSNTSCSFLCLFVLILLTSTFCFFLFLCLRRQGQAHRRQAEVSGGGAARRV